ncbi:Las1-domain-containing protein [Piedraia hortae CBS 480.64]|uniref:Las1-domain-containing protein n=1 Tax=Piedraia hortae CBS 480.64 TaxID=1314780 RepID=A0A6A7C833_9PEZI|nr:Las1-domain-containing protein [Piedraia hortae CBS 480.64]
MAYTTTPWAKHSDLLTVREKLYKTDPSWGVAQVQAWKLRGNNMPHAVESTAQLIDAQLLDRQLAEDSSPSHSTFPLQATYTAAFTRFVTGFCDIGRSRERNRAMSMQAVAKQINMPLDFVHLRHEATHEELPSLVRLRAVTVRALQWLWTVYWDKLPASEAEGLANGTSSRNEGEAVIKAARAYRKGRVEGLRARRSNLWAEAESELKRLCTTGSASKLAKALVDEKCLIPAKRELGDSMKGAFMLWIDLLHDLATTSPAFQTALVSQLLDQLDRDEAPPEAEASYLWLLHLASKGLIKNMNFILRFCCLHPGTWTQELGQKLISKDAELKSDWGSLLQASRIRPLGLSDMGNQNDAPEIKGDTEIKGGWRRALVRPSVPIGVVV